MEEKKEDREKINNPLKKLSFKNEVYKKVFLMGLALLFVAYLFLNSKSIFTGFGVLLGILAPFILGGVIAFIMKIPLNFLERKVFSKVRNEKFQKHKRTISIAISFIFIILVFFLITAIIVPQLINSFDGLRKSLPSFLQMAIDKTREVPYLNNYSDKLQSEYDNLSWNEIFNRIKGFVTSSDNSSQILNGALSTASSILGGLVSFMLALITSIYILADKERLGYQATRICYSFFNNKVANKIIHVAHLLHENFFGFIRGQLTVSTLIGIATFVASFVLRIPNAATLGVIVGVTDLIPIIGPFLGGAMCFIMIVIEDSTKALMFLVLIVILQQVESNLVYPKIVGDKVGLPSLWTLVAITVGGSLFGVVGMWAFIPLASTLYELMREYTKYKIDEKNLDLRMKKI
ncbi:AI-2E family transporter [uncultured Peptoniphilus sp.]|uniref:AI-2E family transporter n=1 Tax=uncultured Peptoniphilus sp. TaxID=254354 RepID=UPI00258D449A|nr:AI-2E family transporter [uncultured Peptoniphilus sp.]MDU6783133.1 AI-2E family transporter [Peptoniphilus harei]